MRMIMMVMAWMIASSINEIWMEQNMGKFIALLIVAGIIDVIYFINRKE